MPLQDHEIVALYHARDEKAIEHSQARYGTYCQTVAMNILNCLADADECVNDTWLAAWNSMPPQKPNSLRAYLGKITRNLSLNRLKANQREKRNVRLTVTLEELEDCISAPDETESRLICQWLNEYLSTLPKLERQLFVGRYWYNYGVKQMARHYGLSPNAVTKRLARLREGLRAYLIERGYTP